MVVLLIDFSDMQASSIFEISRDVLCECMQVSKEKRVHLVEYITHLSLEDWGAVTEDLVRLDFLPADMSEEQLAVISPVIKDVMGQLVIGGTSGISIGSLSIQVGGLTTHVFDSPVTCRTCYMHMLCTQVQVGPEWF